MHMSCVVQNSGHCWHTKRRLGWHQPIQAFFFEKASTTEWYYHSMREVNSRPWPCMFIPYRNSLLASECMLSLDGKILLPILLTNLKEVGFNMTRLVSLRTTGASLHQFEWQVDRQALKWPQILYIVCTCVEFRTNYIHPNLAGQVQFINHFWDLSRMVLYTYSQTSLHCKDMSWKDSETGTILKITRGGSMWS